MDLNTIDTFERPVDPEGMRTFRPGDAWLAGGTWLFSEPQPHLRRLIALDGLGWTPLAVENGDLTIAATCKIAELDAFEAPSDWQAAPLIGECCRAFLASFKIWNMATVGGNLCMSLPAGPMISLCAALDGVCEIWGGDGSVRRLPVLDFVRAPLANALTQGDLLRAITLPARTLTRQGAFRRGALAPMGRSGVLLIGTAAADGAISLTVTASTPRPVRIEFATTPDADGVVAALDAAITPEFYYDDCHGRPDWRRHMTREFALEIVEELKGSAL